MERISDKDFKKNDLNPNIKFKHSKAIKLQVLEKEGNMCIRRQWSYISLKSGP